MNQLIVYVATYNSQRRVDNFIGDYQRCFKKTKEIYGFEPKLVITNTGRPLSSSSIKTIETLNGEVSNHPSKKRCPRDIVYLKIKDIEPYLKGDPILVAWDDDYSVNPYALSVLWKVYKENSKVDFLSLMKPMDYQEWWGMEKLSGFDFITAKTMLGGSSSYRWSAIKDHIYDFFKFYKVDGESSPSQSSYGSFDKALWPFIDHRGGIKTYHLFNFSLIQHCNYFSHYRKRVNTMGHYYGAFYDPYCNPFNLVGVNP